MTRPNTHSWSCELPKVPHVCGHSNSMQIFQQRSNSDSACMHVKIIIAEAACIGEKARNDISGSRRSVELDMILLRYCWDHNCSDTVLPTAISTIDHCSHISCILNMICNSFFILSGVQVPAYGETSLNALIEVVIHLNMVRNLF